MANITLTGGIAKRHKKRVRRIKKLESMIRKINTVGARDLARFKRGRK